MSFFHKKKTTTKANAANVHMTEAEAALAQSDFNIDKILDIQNKFTGGTALLVPGRIFIREGMLWKVCRKGPKKRHFFLFNDILVYGSVVASRYSNQHVLTLAHMTVSGDPTYQPELNAAFNSDTLDEQLDIHNAFQISHADKSFHVFSLSQADKANWLANLQKHINKVALVGGNQTVAPRAVWVPDSHSKECMICTQKFSAFNRKHHCRQCGRVVCSTCSPHRIVIEPQNEGKPERVCNECVKDVTPVKSKGSPEVTPKSTSAVNTAAQVVSNVMKQNNELTSSSSRRNTEKLPRQRRDSTDTEDSDDSEREEDDPVIVKPTPTPRRTQSDYKKIVSPAAAAAAGPPQRPPPFNSTRRPPPPPSSEPQTPPPPVITSGGGSPKPKPRTRKPETELRTPPPPPPPSLVEEENRGGDGGRETEEGEETVKKEGSSERLHLVAVAIVDETQPTPPPRKRKKAKQKQQQLEKQQQQQQEEEAVKLSVNLDNISVSSDQPAGEGDRGEERGGCGERQKDTSEATDGETTKVENGVAVKDEEEVEASGEAEKDEGEQVEGGGEVETATEVVEEEEEEVEGDGEAEGEAKETQDDISQTEQEESLPTETPPADSTHLQEEATPIIDSTHQDDEQSPADQCTNSAAEEEGKENVVAMTTGQDNDQTETGQSSLPTDTAEDGGVQVKKPRGRRPKFKPSEE